MNTLDPRVVNLWRLQGLTRLGTFWLPVLVVGGGWLAFQYGVAAGAGAASGLAALLLGWTLAWPSVSWRHFRYGVREDDLLVESGVLFRHAVSIPLDRIQHVDTRQGPIERLFGLSRLVVYTAAGMSADGSIPGLEEEQADALRDALVRRRGDDGV